MRVNRFWLQAWSKATQPLVYMQLSADFVAAKIYWWRSYILRTTHVVFAEFVVYSVHDVSQIIDDNLFAYCFFLTYSWIREDLAFHVLWWEALKISKNFCSV